MEKKHILVDDYECVKLLVAAGADFNIQVRLEHYHGSVLRKSVLGFAADIGNVETIVLLLENDVHTDGVFIYPTTETDVKNILEAVGACSRKNNSDSSLQNQCREAIRLHLMQTGPPLNLYCKIKQLGLPSLMQHYLLYNVPALSR